MATIEEQLETLFAKVRALPNERQELAILVLTDIIETEAYELSDEERALLEPRLQDAKRGIFASDAEVDEVLNKPWK